MSVPCMWLFWAFLCDHNTDGSMKSGLVSRPSMLAGAMKGTVCNADGDQDSPKVSEHTINGVLEFGMATVKEGSPSMQSICNSSNVGPLVDDSAPYSTIEITELRVLHANDKSKPYNVSPEPKPMGDYNLLRYGQGEHASEPRKILAFISITARSKSGVPINLTHLVLDKSSQWVKRRNVTH